MGQRISIYFTDESLELLDRIVQERPLVIGFKANRSSILCDLLMQCGELYLKRLYAIREAILRYPRPIDLDKDHGDTDEDALAEEQASGPQMRKALAIAREEAAA